MAAPLVQQIAQANFIKTIGAVVPNARIDFQSGLNTPPPPPEIPGLTETNGMQIQTETLPGSCDAVSSVISDCSTGHTSEFTIETLVQRGPEPHETRTPSTGSPEWTPRGTCAERALLVSNEGRELAGQAGQSMQLPYYVSSSQQEIAESSSVAQEPARPDHALQGTQTWKQPAWCEDVAAPSWYRVAYLGGIEVRVQPSVLAARSGVILPQNEVFAVSAEIVGADGRIYLRLADGRGWAFDDSALLPHDPSVVRGHFASRDEVSLTIPQYTPAVLPQTLSHLQHHNVGFENAQEMLSYPHPASGLPVASTCPYQAPASLQTHNSECGVHPAATVCSYTGVILPQESATSLQADTSMPLAESTWVAPDPCLAWPSPVTSDCPPTWEPSVGTPTAESWQPNQLPHYF